MGFKFVGITFLLCIFLGSLSYAYVDVDVTSYGGDNFRYVLNEFNDIIYHCSSASDIDACDSSGVCSTIISGLNDCIHSLGTSIKDFENSIVFVSGHDYVAGTLNITRISVDNVVSTDTLGPFIATLSGNLPIKYILVSLSENIIIFSSYSAGSNRYYVAGTNGTNYHYSFNTGLCTNGHCVLPELSVGGSLGVPGFTWPVEGSVVGPYYTDDIVYYGVHGRGVSTTSLYTRFYSYSDNNFNFNAFPLGATTKFMGSSRYNLIDGTIVYHGFVLGGTISSGVVDFASWPPSSSFSMSQLETSLYNLSGVNLNFNATFKTVQVGGNYKVFKNPDEDITDYILSVNNIIIDRFTSLSKIYITSDDVLVYSPSSGVIRFRSGLSRGPVPGETTPYAAKHTPNMWRWFSMHPERLLSVNGSVVTHPYEVLSVPPSGVVIMESVVGGELLTTQPLGSSIALVYQMPISPGPRPVYSTECNYLSREELILEGDDYSGSSQELRERYNTACLVSASAPNPNDPANLPYMVIASECSSLEARVSVGTSASGASFASAVSLINNSVFNLSIIDSYGGSAGLLSLSRVDDVLTVRVQGEEVLMYGMTGNGTFPHDSRVWITIDSYYDTTIYSVITRSDVLYRTKGSNTILPIRAVRVSTSGTVFWYPWSFEGPQVYHIAPTATPLNSDSTYWYDLDSCTYTRPGQRIRVRYDLIELSESSPYFDMIINVDTSVAAIIAQEEALRAVVQRQETNDKLCSWSNGRICSTNDRLLFVLIIMVTTVLITLLIIVGLDGSVTMASLLAMGVFVLEFCIFAALGWIPTWLIASVVIMTAAGVAFVVRNVVVGGGNIGR